MIQLVGLTINDLIAEIAVSGVIGLTHINYPDQPEYVSGQYNIGVFSENARLAFYHQALREVWVTPGEKRYMWAPIDFATLKHVVYVWRLNPEAFDLISFVMEQCKNLGIDQWIDPSEIIATWPPNMGARI